MSHNPVDDIFGDGQLPTDADRFRGMTPTAWQPSNFPESFPSPPAEDALSGKVVTDTDPGYPDIGLLQEMVEQDILSGLEDEGKPSEPARHRSTLNIQWGKVLVALGSAVVVVALVVVGIPAIDNAFKPKPTPSQSAAVLDSGTPLGDPVLYTGAVLPGYSDTTKWNFSRPSGVGAVGANDAAIGYVKKNRFVLLSVETGEKVFDTKINGPVQWFSSTMVGDHLVPMWRIANSIYWWPGGNVAEHVDLPDGAQVSFAGESPLITAAGDAYTISDTGELVQSPSGAGTAVAADRRSVIRIDATHLDQVTVVSGTSSKAVPLAAPRTGMVPIRWVASGHQTSVLLWSPVQSPAASTTVSVVVYDLGTGKATSAVDVPYSAVADASWVRTSGSRMATYKVLAVDLDTHKVAWTCPQNCTMEGGVGRFIQVSTEQGPAMVAPDGTVALTRNVTKVATDTVAVMSGTGDSMQGYPKSQ